MSSAESVLVDWLVCSQAASVACAAAISRWICLVVAVARSGVHAGADRGQHAVELDGKVAQRAPGGLDLGGLGLLVGFGGEHGSDGQAAMVAVS